MYLENVRKYNKIREKSIASYYYNFNWVGTTRYTVLYISTPPIMTNQWVIYISLCSVCCRSNSIWTIKDGYIQIASIKDNTSVMIESLPQFSHNTSELLRNNNWYSVSMCLIIHS